MLTSGPVLRVDLGRLARNMDAIREMVGPHVAVMAVVKANAYGHGAVEIAPTLLEHGATYLAVARLEEAEPLRAAYPACPIFVLGRTPDEMLERAVKMNLTLCCFSAEQARLLGQYARRMGKTAKVHLKVETGFHRLGTDDVEELYRICTTDGIEAEGIYTHLALLDRPSDEAQLAKFMGIVQELEDRGVSFRYRHVADSIASVHYPDFRLDMVRPGALIYGMRDDDSPEQPPVETVLSMETTVARLCRVEAGEGVGYDLLWRAEKPSLLATLPFGYADGYPRSLTGKGYVSIRGVACPIVGLLCMDQCVADVTEVPEVAVGDRVLIYGDEKENALTFPKAAKLAGTNKNELLARLNARAPREYVSSCVAEESVVY